MAGNSYFWEATSKRTSGNSEGRNRNGNLVQSKGFLLIAAPEEAAVAEIENCRKLERSVYG